MLSVERGEDVAVGDGVGIVLLLLEPGEGLGLFLLDLRQLEARAQNEVREQVESSRGVLRQQVQLQTSRFGAGQSREVGPERVERARELQGIAGARPPAQRFDGE
jgi:hypothetical protein